MILNKQSLFEDLLERPPNTLNIFRRHRPIGFLEINPKAHAMGHLTKFADMALNRFTALLIESCDSKFFDIAFASKSKFLLNSNLNG